MEETKIWSIEGTSATPLNTTNRMESEGLLEDILTANPDMLEQGLELVGRQTSTAGGPLDLLGVDSDGRLVVYELKRGRLNRDAVAQVIDYASSLDAMDEGTLYRHISERSGNLGIQKIDNFGDWHSNNWPEGGFDSLMPPRMVLVGLGVDDTTERMVNYMVSIGMDISLLTFHGFIGSDGNTLLARNVEVDRADTAVSIPRRARSRARGNRTGFLEHAQSLSLDARGVLDGVERMVRDQISGYTTGYVRANTRMNFSLDYSWQENSLNRRVSLFVEIVEEQNIINVGFYPPSIALVSRDEFNKLKQDGINFEEIETQAIRGPEGITNDIKFPINSQEEWDAKRVALTALTRKFREAYNAAKDNAQAAQ